MCNVKIVLLQYCSIHIASTKIVLIYVDDIFYFIIIYIIHIFLVMTCYQHMKMVSIFVTF